MTVLNPVLWPDPGGEAWNEFCEALWRALGEDVPGRCLNRHYFAHWLLAERGYDVEQSLALYERRGGHCDCEILLNVDREREETPPA